MKEFFFKQWKSFTSKGWNGPLYVNQVSTQPTMNRFLMSRFDFKKLSYPWQFQKRHPVASQVISEIGLLAGSSKQGFSSDDYSFDSFFQHLKNCVVFRLEDWLPCASPRSISKESMSDSLPPVTGPWGPLWWNFVWESRVLTILSHNIKDD